MVYSAIRIQFLKAMLHRKTMTFNYVMEVC